MNSEMNDMEKLKIVYMGTPEFAKVVFENLHKEYDIVLVVTQPDKIVGRKKEIVYSMVKDYAIKNNIEVFQPEKIREDYDKIKRINPDIIITCAYGQIIPKALLEIPKYGSINVHASLLPKLRGGAPIHKAIIDDYKETGVTIMYMDEKMDTGNVISKVSCPILDEDNVGTLHDKLAFLGSKLLLETLPLIISGKNESVKQDDKEATYAWNIKREEEHLNFNNKSRDVFNHIRGLNPWPSANMILNDEEYKVFDSYYEIKDIKGEISSIVDITKDAIGIKTIDGIVYVTKIKPFGKKTMLVKEYLNGINKDKLLNSIVK